MRSVMPGDRQRRRKITLACEPCRERKSRCDGKKPVCSPCERRSLGLEQCIYQAGNARTASGDDYTRALRERIRGLEQACAAHGIDVASLDSAASTPVRRPAHWGAGGPSSDDGSPSVLAVLERDAPHKTPLANSPDVVPVSENAGSVTAMGTVLSEEDLDGTTQVADDFYGQSSAASFLKEACGSMGREPNRLSGRQPRAQAASRVGRAGATLAGIERFTLPPRALADHLLQRYWDRVYYLYPFFDRPAFEHAYQSLWQPDETRTGADRFRGLGLGGAEADADSIVFHCALNAVFALGCCFSDRIPDAEKAAATEAFFERAKVFVGLDFLDTNNVGVVQALLVTALVLQGTMSPDRCWNSVGVACRVAQGLGLHAEGRRSDAREREIRRRTWHGCVIMDMLVSMTFGRPTMTSSLSVVPDTLDIRPTASADADPEQLKLFFHRENVRLTVILEGILQKIYQPWLGREPNAGIHHSLDTVVELQGQLAAFEQSVAPFLSWISSVTPKISTRDKAILDTQRNVLHARFIYMHIILHRPTLTQLSADGNTDRQVLSSDRLRHSFALECGKSCVEAAKQLIGLIHDIYPTETSDAWWWIGLYACTAGLVLIVARLCPALLDAADEAERALLWTRCQAILQHQATFSVSARKSLDLILKVNEQVSLRARSDDSQAQTLVQDPGADDAPQGYIEMMAQLDPATANLEDTYMMMGPMFTWDADFAPSFS